MPLDRDISYLEQGYANVAAAPLMMQVNQMRESNLRINDMERRDREGSRIERDRIKSDMVRDDYMKHLDQVANDPSLSDQERNARNDNYIKTHPDLLMNDQALNMTKREQELSGRSFKRKELTNQEKEQDLIGNELAFNERMQSTQQDLAEKQISLAMEQVAFTKDGIERQRDAYAKGDFSNASYVIAQAFPDEEDKDARNAASAMAYELSESKDPNDLKFLTFLSDATMGMKAGGELSRVFSSSLSRHNGLAQELNSSFRGLNLFDAVSDPATRSENLAQLNGMIEAELNKPGTKMNPQIRGQFKEFSEGLAKVASVEGTYGQLKKDLGEAVTELRPILTSLDPKDKQKAMELKARILVASKSIEAYVNKEYENKAFQEKERATELEEMKMLNDMSNRKRALDQGEQRIIQNQINSRLIDQAKRASAKGSMAKTLQAMDENGFWDNGREGISSDSSDADKINYIYNLPEFSSSSSSGNGVEIP